MIHESKTKPEMRGEIIARQKTKEGLNKLKFERKKKATIWAEAYNHSNKFTNLFWYFLPKLFLWNWPFFLISERRLIGIIISTEKTSQTGQDWLDCSFILFRINQKTHVFTAGWRPICCWSCSDFWLRRNLARSLGWFLSSSCKRRRKPFL